MCFLPQPTKDILAHTVETGSKCGVPYIDFLLHSLIPRKESCLITKRKLPDFWEKLGNFLFVIRQLSHFSRFRCFEGSFERI